MDYIIRNFDVAKGQLTVEYDGKWTYAVDLPIEDGAFPIGERLEEVIQGMAPIWLTERQAALAGNPANVEVIQALVQPLPEENNVTLNDSFVDGDIEFIKDIVNEVLTAKGL
jgi:hypothetical protein